MSQNEKTRALLDDEQQTEDTEKQEEEVILDPAEQLKKLCRGKLKLMFPFRAASQDVTELSYDLCDLTGAEIISALDSVPVNNVFAITNEQAMAIFAISAAKCAPFIDEGNIKSRLYDAKDIQRRISGVDMIKAVQVAKLFYNASSRAGNNNISNE